MGTISLIVLGTAMVIAFRYAYFDDGDTASLFSRGQHVPQLLFLPVVVAVSFIRPIREKLSRAIDSLRAPSRHAKLITAIVIAVVAFLYLWRAAVLHDRDLSPRIQDEFSYLIQAQLLARGTLWLPTPPLADFFETFHVIVRPVYASVYFPGTAMLYVPSVWLHAPHYWTALLICAASVALVYLFATELLDGAYGMLAALMLLTTRAFYIHSTLALSNVPAMLAGMCFLLAWLKWTRANSLRAQAGWMIAIGAIGGWGLIVRPLDMIAYIIAAIVGQLIVRRDPAPCPSHKGRGVMALAVVAAIPFFALQLAFNKGVTGSFVTTPYHAYFDAFQPNTGFGLARPDDPNVHPQTDLHQKHDLYNRFLRPLISMSRWEMFTRWRIKFTTSATLPSDLFLILLPLGAVAAFRDRRLVVALLVPILFLALYALYPYYMTYYALAIAPCVIVVALAGLRAVSKSDIVKVCGYVATIAICIAALPETRFDFGEELDALPGLKPINQLLPLRAKPPAVVLFTYSEGAQPHEEPVYNYDVANPLDAPIIRAQDLGDARNRELIDYFAVRRPQTNIYRFDRGARQLEFLGTAEQLRNARSSPRSSR